MHKHHCVPVLSNLVRVCLSLEQWGHLIMTGSLWPYTRGTLLYFLSFSVLKNSANFSYLVVYSFVSLPLISYICSSGMSFYVFGGFIVRPIVPPPDFFGSPVLPLSNLLDASNVVAFGLVSGPFITCSAVLLSSSSISDLLKFSSSDLAWAWGDFAYIFISA